MDLDELFVVAAEVRVGGGRERAAGLAVAAEGGATGNAHRDSSVALLHFRRNLGHSETRD
jgi:hypothetical protein